MDHDEAALAHVSQQDPDDADGQVKVGGQVGDGGRQAASAQDGQVLGPRYSGSAAMPLTADTSASRWSLAPPGRVRPPVTAYGRTTGPASWSSHWSSGESMAGHIAAADGAGRVLTVMCSPTRLTSTAIS